MDTKRKFLAALGAILVVGTALAQETFPSRPIRIVVSFTPGGGADFTARTVGQKMGNLLGVPVIVENKPGANGTIGCELVAKALPDGYTILETDRGALGINPSLYKSLPYDPLTDFEYLGIVTAAPYVLVVNSRLPVKTLAEFGALSKASPARSTTAATASPAWRCSTSRAPRRSWGSTSPVPYKGAGPAVQAVVAARRRRRSPRPPRCSASSARAG
jgi:tripartite-type tricarboxylate transporter receptor subunit TctC